ncbi:MAG: S1 RNA-binding domain-containing protein [Candidatus Omnitrophica bacterium]|nr:S1 RNA-binding domain-containing protein [Candidatus Omnitrophota bacterium]
MQVNGFKTGDIVEVQVAKIHAFGAIVILPNDVRGLIHISQVSDDFVKNVADYLKVGDKLSARIKKISADGKIDLTLKKKEKPVPATVKEKEFKFSIFQEKIEEFLKKSK